jgi:hypothetical protein
MGGRRMLHGGGGDRLLVDRTPSTHEPAGADAVHGPARPTNISRCSRTS